MNKATVRVIAISAVVSLAAIYAANNVTAVNKLTKKQGI